MGATVQVVSVRRDRRVSTHAPVMGATHAQSQCRQATRVSTHAPVMGATWAVAAARAGAQGFNPRARDGRDKLDAVIAACTTSVSTHAPVMGATRLPGTAWYRHWFQPTRP